MTDLLLSMNILLQSGGLGMWEFFDDSLTELVTSLDALDLPLTGTIITWSKLLAQAICVYVVSHECFKLLTGNADASNLMPIFRAMVLSGVIGSWTYVTTALQAPGKALEQQTRALAQGFNAQVTNANNEFYEKAYEYSGHLIAATVKTKSIEEVYHEAGGGISGVGAVLSEATDIIGTAIENVVMTLENLVISSITFVIGMIINCIFSLIFQAMYYGNILISKFFLCVLTMTGPIAFAISLAPPFANTWSQWVSKYFSITLYPFLTYLAIIFIDQILLYTYAKDTMFMENLISQAADVDVNSFGTIMFQQLSCLCQQVIGLLIGIYILQSVHEVAAWILPTMPAQGGSGWSQKVPRVAQAALKKAV